MGHPNRPTDPNHAESAHEPDTASDEPLDMNDLIAAVLGAADPRNLRDVNPAVKAVALPAARRFAADANPGTREEAWRMLWALAPFLVWTFETFGSVDPGVLTPRNVNAYVFGVNVGQPPPWRSNVLSMLRRVGRVVNPHGWPEESPPVGRVMAAVPYSDKDLRAFLMSAGLPGRANLVQRLVAAAFPLGVGAKGHEVVLAETGDVHEVGNGRLKLQVRGRNPRLVPVRACCTNAVRRAISLVEEGEPGANNRFFLTDDPATPARIANKISIGDTTLRMRRARNTWLAAHLAAGTSLPMLKKIAGPLSMQTLDDLLAYSEGTIDPEQAVIEGLRA